MARLLSGRNQQRRHHDEESTLHSNDRIFSSSLAVIRLRWIAVNPRLAANVSEILHT